MLILKGIMKQEQWIEEVMNSAAGARRAEPPANFTEAFMLRINGMPEKQATIIPLKWAVAAAIVMVTLNVAVLTAYSTNAMHGGNSPHVTTANTDDYNTEVVYKY